MSSGTGFSVPQDLSTDGGDDLGAALQTKQFSSQIESFLTFPGA
jgi:hypothetical protein